MFPIKRWLNEQLTGGCLEPKSPAFKPLFPKNAKIKRIATGFQYFEVDGF